MALETAQGQPRLFQARMRVISPRGEMSASPQCPNCHRAGLALVPCSAWLELSPGMAPSIRWQEGRGGGGGAATGMVHTLSTL